MGVTKVAALDLGFVATQVTPYHIFTLYRKGKKAVKASGRYQLYQESKVSLYQQKKTLIANYKKVVPQPHHFGTLDSI